jgi:heptosyltransferase III
MKLLLIVPGAIGDFIVTLPSVAWLRQKLKPNYLEIWSEWANLPLAVSSGHADRALALAVSGLDRWPTPEQVISRLKQFDHVISWHGASFPEWKEQMRRCVPRIAFLAGFPRDLELHAMDFRKRQVQSLFGADDTFPLFPQIEISREATRFAQENLAVEIGDARPMMVVHPGASSRRKQWGTDRFAHLVTLLAETSNQVLVCEGPLDHEVVNEVLASVPAHHLKTALRQIRTKNLMQLAAMIQCCRLYIGNDSGIGHLAAGTGIPTLSLFTLTNPAVWAPRGREVRVLQSPSVKEVLQVAAEMRSRKHDEGSSSGLRAMAPLQ